MDAVLFALIALGAGLIAWRNSMRAREHAIQVCRSACRRAEVQLLDDTVVLSRISVVRPSRGGMRLRRVYEFEASVDGITRRGGTVTLTGDRIDAVFVPERA